MAARRGGGGANDSSQRSRCGNSPSQFCRNKAVNRHGRQRVDRDWSRQSAIGKQHLLQGGVAYARSVTTLEVEFHLFHTYRLPSKMTRSDLIANLAQLHPQRYRISNSAVIGCLLRMMARATHYSCAPQMLHQIFLQSPTGLNEEAAIDGLM